MQNNIVIMAPTAHAIHRTLAQSDDCAKEFYVQFNAEKSKCIYFGNSKASRLLHHRTDLTEIRLRLSVVGRI